MKLEMPRGAFGIPRKINVKDAEIKQGDILCFIIKSAPTADEEEIISKEETVNTISEGIVTITPTLTKEESDKLDVGNYVWGIKHIRKDSNNVILSTALRLTDEYYSEFVVREGI